jgi:Na+/proline symporter
MELDRIQKSKYSREFYHVDSAYTFHHNQRKEATYELVKGIRTEDERLVTKASLTLKHHEAEGQKIREEAKSLIKKNHPAADMNDTNYIFLTFVIRYLPEGVIGLLIAVIIAASMSSTSSALNALASTSIIDIYKRSFKKHADASHYLGVSRIATVIWGTVAMLVAMFANKMGSLIEAVNILGSLFYGTILGIFVCGFYFRKLRGHAVFYAALITETIIILCYIFTDISFLWYNLIGCFLVTFIAYLLQYTVQPFLGSAK